MSPRQKNRLMTFLVLWLFGGFPGGDVAGFGAEGHADADDRARIGCELVGVVFIADLVKSLFWCAVALQLDDVYAVAHAQQQVDAALRGVPFGACVNSYQHEEDEQVVLVMKFRGPVGELIGDSGHER